MVLVMSTESNSFSVETDKDVMEGNAAGPLPYSNILILKCSLRYGGRDRWTSHKL